MSLGFASQICCQLKVHLGHNGSSVSLSSAVFLACSHTPKEPWFRAVYLVTKSKRLATCLVLVFPPAMNPLALWCLFFFPLWIPGFLCFFFFFLVSRSWLLSEWIFPLWQENEAWLVLGKSIFHKLAGLLTSGTDLWDWPDHVVGPSLLHSTARKTRQWLQTHTLLKTAGTEPSGNCLYHSLHISWLSVICKVILLISFVFMVFSYLFPKNAPKTFMESPQL